MKKDKEIIFFCPPKSSKSLAMAQYRSSEVPGMYRVQWVAFSHKKSLNVDPVVSLKSVPKYGLIFNDWANSLGRSAHPHPNKPKYANPLSAAKVSRVFG